MNLEMVHPGGPVTVVLAFALIERLSHHNFGSIQCEKRSCKLLGFVNPGFQDLTLAQVTRTFLCIKYNVLKQETSL